MKINGDSGSPCQFALFCAKSLHKLLTNVFTHLYRSLRFLIIAAEAPVSTSPVFHTSSVLPKSHFALWCQMLSESLRPILRHREFVIIASAACDNTNRRPNVQTVAEIVTKSLKVSPNGSICTCSKILRDAEIQLIGLIAVRELLGTSYQLLIQSCRW